MLHAVLKLNIRGYSLDLIHLLSALAKLLCDEVQIIPKEFKLTYCIVELLSKVSMNRINDDDNDDCTHNTGV